MFKIGSIFKKNDIRGVYPTELDESIAMKIGYIFGKKIGEEKNVVLAGDCRISTPSIKTAIIHGLNAAGVNTFDMGMGPTPMVYFIAKTVDFIDAGIIVTASHNPKQYNGIKICDSEGLSYNDVSLFNEIKLQLNEVNVAANNAKNLNNDGLDLANQYFTYLSDNFELRNKIRVIVDYGNGAVGEFSAVLENIGCDVTSIRREPNGDFPSIIPDPTKEKTFGEIKSKFNTGVYDIGIAFDTDGDRVGFMTPKNTIISPDLIVMLFGEYIMREKEAGIIIFDLKMSKASADFLEEKGVKIEYSQTGHSWVHKKLIETQADLAAELSCHYYFENGYYGFDDGLYSALRFLLILDQLISDGNDIDSKLNDLPKYHSTPEYRVKMPYGVQDTIIEKLKDYTQSRSGKIIDLDGVRGEFDDGWFIARKSGTEEALSYRIESKTEDGFINLKQDVLEIINNR